MISSCVRDPVDGNNGWPDSIAVNSCDLMKYLQNCKEKLIKKKLRGILSINKIGSRNFIPFAEATADGGYMATLRPVVDGVWT